MTPSNLGVESRLLGISVKRKEDPRLITGGGMYVDDLKLPRMLHLAFLRSPHAHARINNVDVHEARGMAGVVDVITGEELKDSPGPLTFPSSDELKAVPHYPLAWDKVRHVGDPVAAVLATDRYVARDAADAIVVDYEPLPAVVDVEDAIATGAPVLHDDVGTNEAQRRVFRRGEVDEVFGLAEATVSARLENQRLAPICMETRGIVADYQPWTGELTLWMATQGAHGMRAQYADFFHMPEMKIRIIAPDVGGGFGAKFNLYIEEALAAFLARKHGRPVKWAADRSEDVASTTHGRAQRAYFEVGCKRDGTILGIRGKLYADFGAYLQNFTSGVNGMTTMMLGGCYQIQAYDIEAIGAYTNATPIDAYRGAGRPEAAFYIERIVDLVASELGLDPVEVRRKNFIPADKFPFYHTVAGPVYDTADYEKALTKALELAGYEDFRQRQQRARSEGRWLGIGFSTYTEICGIGPSKFLAEGMGHGMYETATIKFDPSGGVTVISGSSPHGQGHETAFAQIVSNELHVPFDEINVKHGDTGDGGMGIGTFGSRSAPVGGAAVLTAAQRVREKMTRIAASMLEASPSDVALEEGHFSVRGSPGKAVTVREVVRKAYMYMPDEEQGLEATSFFDPPNFVFPFGTHICEVEVDAETGKTQLLRFMAVDDVGNVISPMLVDGQVHGGLAQGIAQALYEEVVYDRESGQLLTGNLADYEMPGAREMLQFETARTETPTPVNPLGAKGVGEAGTIGGIPAVTNAVMDALSHLGIRNLDTPLTPEKVWQAIREATV
ncbi:MAG TPA: xanthine dehydrogenase family protein molybdopterin-binding subunit [Chloroflexota bacterium]|nr:xanthine dehydrogenase family protein molybdopterin-binding subunit [Chloroflexota bacterium]